MHFMHYEKFIIKILFQKSCFEISRKLILEDLQTGISEVTLKG